MPGMMKVNYESARDVKHGLIQHFDELVMPSMMKVNYETTREVKDGLVPSVDRQNYKVTSTPHHGNSSALDVLPDMADSDNINQNEGAHVEVPYSILTGKVEVFRKDSVSYTDKNITVLELSEEVVCFEDVSYHDVKDICVDEGVHSPEKNLVETNEEDDRNSFSQNPFATDETDDVTKNLSNCIIPISDDLKLLLENEHPICVVGKDDASQCSQNLLEAGGKLNSNNQLTSEFSAEEPSVQQVLTLPELNMDLAQVDSSGSSTTNNLKQLIEPRRKIEQVKLEEGKPGTRYVSFAENESSKSNDDKENPVDLKVEGGVITFNFDSGTAAESRRVESKDNAGAEQCGQAQNYTKFVETSTNDAAASARSSFVHHGELGFPGTASLSGRIAFSGHIPYSGSISLRSDSSTTSARSFAFPVLHSEWNSSPVKMAKADRRRLRKHRGWGMRFICCQF